MSRRKTTMSTAQAKVTAKCLMCNEKFKMDDKDIETANEMGCIVSPCCGFPAVLVKAEVTVRKVRS